MFLRVRVENVRIQEFHIWAPYESDVVQACRAWGRRGLGRRMWNHPYQAWAQAYAFKVSATRLAGTKGKWIPRIIPI